MKILRLNAYYLPEVTPSNHLLSDMNEAFEANQVEYSIITPVPTRGIEDDVRKKYLDMPVEKTNNGYVEVRRFPLQREGRNSVQRAFRYVLLNVKEYFLAVKQKNVNVVFTSSTPPTQGVLGGLVAKKLSKRYGHKVPFVFNLQDIFPDSLVNAGMTRKGSLLWKLGRKMEDFIYRNADRIIVISEDFKQNIMAKGVPEEKIVIVPNWINTEHVHPIPREENVLFDRYQLDRSRYYISYSGNIGHSQNMDLLLRAAKELKTAMPDVTFVLIGEGAAKEAIAQRIADEKLDNVIMLPFQPEEDIAHVFSFADADLVISKPGVGGSSVPSKTWGIMASGRPLLASFDSNSELVRIVRAVDCGLCSEADDLDAFITSIRALHDDRARADAMGRRGREYVCRELNKDVCTAAYIDVLRAAASGKHGC